MLQITLTVAVFGCVLSQDIFFPDSDVTVGSQLPKECGIANSVFKTRDPLATEFRALSPSKMKKRGEVMNHGYVAGGRTAEFAAYPWMALIGDEELSFYCGGSLITDQYVITAAHCVDKRNRFVVRLGEHDQTQDSETMHIDIPVSNFLVHPGYLRKGNLIQNDMAILKLATPVTFSRNIRPICLPSWNYKLEDFQTVTVAGWGDLSFGGAAATELQFAELSIQRQKKCMDVYSKLRTPITSTLLCASNPGKDACGGDSGGPLMDKNRVDGKFYLVGVVSFGYKCADPNYPGVFSRVTSYLDWIKATSL